MNIPCYIFYDNHKTDNISIHCGLCDFKIDAKCPPSPIPSLEYIRPILNKLVDLMEHQYNTHPVKSTLNDVFTSVIGEAQIRNPKTREVPL